MGGDHQDLAADTLLKQPVTALPGVDGKVAKVLNKLQIYSVFDLANSRLFNTAREISEGVQGKSVAGRFGTVASDRVTGGSVDKSLNDIATGTVEALEGVGEVIAKDIREQIKTDTVKDLGSWAPFQIAREIQNEALGFDDDLPDDPDAPRELLPTAGNFPTEKRQYHKIFLDEQNLFGGTEGTTELIQPVDLLDSTPTGFTRPTTGALLTFEQSWIPIRLSLGHLLHSLALAPAESTKIAVVDWSRRSEIDVNEGISETEDLRNSFDQARAIDETMRGVVAEVQEGNSTVTSNSSGSTSGTPPSIGSALLNDVSFGLLGSKKSRGAASNSSQVISVSASSGRREVTSETLQDIKASTQQNASATRNRRASIVREASQQESESVSTRTVTNYNHSHALSIHYYEVVQIYRTLVQLKKAQRVIFIPMKVFNFSDERLIDRYKSILIDNALDRLTAELLANASGEILTTVVGAIPRHHGRKRSIASDMKLREIRIERGKSSIKEIVVNIGGDRPERLAVQVTDDNIIRFPSLPDAAEITNISYSYISPGGIPIKPVFRFVFENNTNLRGFRVEFTLSDKGESGSIQESKILDFTPPRVNLEVADLLNEDALHYSRAIWNNLNEQDIAFHLANFTYEGVRIAQHIDPIPLATYGNYLVFQYFHGDDPEKGNSKSWEEWKRRHVDFQRVEEEIVPLPTGGVFAESVLGRFNGSEKLDITRFWDWQSSPIPFAAPDIAAIQTGVRGQDEDLPVGQLGAPVVNIQNPQPFPDPQGTLATLQLLGASNIFRDLTGLSGAFGLAQAGQIAAQQSASRSEANALQFEEFRINTIRDIVSQAVAAAMGVPSAPTSGVGRENPSYTGAMLNHAQKLDARSAANNGGSGVTGGAGGGGASGSSGGGGASGGGGTVSAERITFNRAVSPQGSLLEELRSDLENATADSGSDAGLPASVLVDLNEYDPGDNVNRNQIEFMEWQKGAFYEKVTEREVLLSHFDVDQVDLKREHMNALRTLATEIKQLLAMESAPAFPHVRFFSDDRANFVFNDRRMETHPLMIFRPDLIDSPIRTMFQRFGFRQQDEQLTDGAFVLNKGYYLGRRNDAITKKPIVIRVAGNASQTGNELNNEDLARGRHNAVPNP